MHNWTVVYLPYCDGGSGIGNAALASPPLFFRGAAIREAVRASLVATLGLGAATDLLIGGQSAGGLAAYINVDWWAAAIPGARTGAIPDSCVTGVVVVGREAAAPRSPRAPARPHTAGAGSRTATTSATARRTTTRGWPTCGR